MQVEAPMHSTTSIAMLQQHQVTAALWHFGPTTTNNSLGQDLSTSRRDGGAKAHSSHSTALGDETTVKACHAFVLYDSEQSSPSTDHV